MAEKVHGARATRAKECGNGTSPTSDRIQQANSNAGRMRARKGRDFATVAGASDRFAQQRIMLPAKKNHRLERTWRHLDHWTSRPSKAASQSVWKTKKQRELPAPRYSGNFRPSGIEVVERRISRRLVSATHQRRGTASTLDGAESADHVWDNRTDREGRRVMCEDISES
ncbi:hypothetical protein B0H10DRAFT_1957914 [Mycena sp. CBHHK59/15]|nr:hypothetical protein B0H10DRAFT_1957914 [Mycena sp. CBHHK59/15]